jgi:hypothetical protein
VGPVGTQQDAAFALRASVPAGTYHVICDAVITAPVDVNFALIWRRPPGLDTQLAAWSKHWEPRGPGMFDAQPYEVDMAAPAIDFQPGDQLVFRYAGAGTTGTTSSESFIPNGDGPNSNGRIPSITLPR